MLRDCQVRGRYVLDVASNGAVVGLFAGIGGIELGLHEAGYETALLCEVDPAAKAVLQARFPDVELHDDVADLKALPDDCAVLTAGFPCQDLSQAGRLAGIDGSRSGLVGHVFRLLDGAQTPPDWLVLENVPFMLQLDRGRAMQPLTEQLDERGFRWAYRIVDARAFGVPQRRRRVLLVASRTLDPRPVLFSEDAQEPPEPDSSDVACGFYWTEGNTGLGWAVDAVPTIKGGSGLGIPSPPAIWMQDGSIVTPDIRDAERLQGFEADWTLPAVEAGHRASLRWKMVGNAVCVPMAAWLGKQLADNRDWDDSRLEIRLDGVSRWPAAAWGEDGLVSEVVVSEWPIEVERPCLTEFLRYDPAPLSERAINGFRERLAASSLRHPPKFMTDLAAATDGKTDHVPVAQP